MNEIPVSKQYSQFTAFLLCLFLGGLGVHRFYAGRIGTGILWLFTLGLFGIGSLVDLILITFGGFRAADGSYLRGDGMKIFITLVVFIFLIVAIIAGTIAIPIFIKA